MKKLSIMLLFIFAKSAFSQTVKPLHFSVIQQLSTEGLESKNNSYYFSINLFSGTVKSIKGLEIGSFYNQNNGNMVGAQYSGLVNDTKDSLIGLQVAGLANITGNVIGFQQAGLYNQADNVIGLQISGVVNVAQNLRGLQLGGIVNKAKVLSGLQIGLINLTDSVTKGGAIGLINIVKKNGYREIEISIADYQNIGISYKSGIKAIYSIISAGYNFGNQPLFVSGWGLGSLFELRKQKCFFKPELIGFSYLDNFTDAQKGANSVHLRLGLMRKQNKVGISIMPSIYYTKTYQNNQAGLVELSPIKPFSRNAKSGFGFGFSLGISILK